jgi:DinB superfamily
MATPIDHALGALLSELVYGTAPPAGWVLNPEDPGLLRSLAKLTAAAASVPAPGGGPSIAAHVDHLRYGLELLNRSRRGEDDPFATADYSASWRRQVVSESEWATLCDQLRAEAQSWLDAIRRPPALGEADLAGALASAAHLAYHMGAIRQIDRATRGPSASD